MKHLTKLFILFTLLILFSASPARAAIAVVAHTSDHSSAGNGFTTGTAKDTTGANLIILHTGCYDVATVSDNKSNTYTALTSHNTSGNYISRLFYLINPNVGSGHTWTVTGSSTYCSIEVLAVSGAATGGFDQQNGANHAGATTSLLVGSVTPSEDNELLVVGGQFGDSTGAPNTIDVGFTVIESQNNTAGSEESSLAYLIETTATAKNPTWTSTGGTPNNTSGSIATFKAAPVVGASRMLLLGVGD